VVCVSCHGESYGWVEWEEGVCAGDEGGGVGGRRDGGVWGGTFVSCSGVLGQDEGETEEILIRGGQCLKMVGVKSWGRRLLMR
jgi:hypothetical protein